MTEVAKLPPLIAARPPRWAFVLAGAALIALIAGLHGRCVMHGLFLDDHAHYTQLQQADWSLRGLTDACRLDLVGSDGYIDLWWLPEIKLRFFRPVAFGLMKAAYAASGWSAAALHVASLCWHALNCVLLLILLHRLGATLPIAWGSAALFAIHPGDIAAVQWIASQTELIVTAFLLGATFCHASWSGWWRRDGEPSPGRLRRGLALGGALVLFAAALGCRENAIMLPLVLLVGDWIQRRLPLSQRLVRIAPYLVLAIAYLALRTHMLGGAALPPKPYVIPPSDPDFVRFVFDKACYYLIGHVFLVPTVPFGGIHYFREHPVAFYSLSGAAAALLLAAVLIDRRHLAGWLGATWLVLFMGPVLPAFESPHHLYLPGIGWAILAMILFRALLGAADASRSRLTAIRRISVWAGASALGTGFGLACFFGGTALHAAQQVEDRLVDEILTAPHPIKDGDTLYIANLPCISHYVKLVLEERSGVRNLNVVGLTWSPRLLGNQTPTELSLVNPRTLEMRIIGDRYFSGPFGALSRAATGRATAVSPQSPIDHPDFRVECLEADENGIAGLRFTFREPVPAPGRHLFWGSRTRWAWQVTPAQSSAAQKNTEGMP